MHLYVFEPRADRMAALGEELARERVSPVALGAPALANGAPILGQDGCGERALLMADLPETPELIRQIRLAGRTNPILVLRDMRGAQRTAELLDGGADDVVIAPLKAVELKSRIASILRRAHGHATGAIEIGEITAYLSGRDPEIGGQPVPLTRKEHEVFRLLALNATRLVTKDAIFDALYGMSDKPPYDKIIDVYICTLRKKIAAAARSGHNYIETVSRRGYRLAPPRMTEAQGPAAAPASASEPASV